MLRRLFLITIIAFALLCVVEARRGWGWGGRRGYYGRPHGGGWGRPRYGGGYGWGRPRYGGGWGHGYRGGWYG
ncbi:hypothetical protein ANCCAN_22912 [Ancylostoma caninum]|uniref:Neuropeptide-like protein 31 family protein n=1 Tax=Ancylostoma caninum TaxID=29170 RepID=A0A368FGH0_ANCCA|nr:hypothetical protein ANCCAN_22912 [Ancylostoma caninum]